MESQIRTERPIRIAGAVLRYLAPLLVILAGAFVAKILIEQRKAPPKSAPPPRVLPVDVVVTEVRDHAWFLDVYGTTAALRSVSLRPTVAGPVVRVHPDLVVGGRVSAGDVLVEVDRRDYELSVAVARANLVTAESDLEIERGNASVAARELDLLSGDFELTAAQRRLALREPIIAQREAAVETARTQLAQAELNLERTALVAPFDAIVTVENVEMGTVLGMGADVATLVATDTYVIEVSLPASRLADLRLDGGSAKVWTEDGEPLPGRIARLLAEVDAAGRMARLQIEVDDPLRRAPAQPLLLGSFVRVGLPLAPAPNSVAIPRGALREGGRVWLVNPEEQLELRDVTVALQGDTEVLVTEGLEGGERVITSSIAVPVPGMRVLPLGEPAPAPSAAPAASTAEAIR